MDDVSALEYLRYLNAFGEYIVQNQHLRLGFVVHPPVRGCVQVNHRQVHLFLDRFVLVLFLSLKGIYDHRAVVGAGQFLMP